VEERLQIMAEDEDAGPKPNHANADDEFLRHPVTGAFFRNPLRDSAAKPIIMSLSEYEHNCLDNALSTWHSVSMPESVFKKMTQGKAASHEAQATGTVKTLDIKTKAALRRLDRVTGQYEYVVTVRKSQYVPPRGHRRHAAPVNPAAMQLEKLAIDVVPEMDGMRLKVETIGEGLIAAWNRANPSFAVRPMDYITRIDGQRGNAQSLVDTMVAAEDALKITFMRVTNRTASKMSIYTQDGQEQDLAATLSPGDIAGASS